VRRKTPASIFFKRQSSGGTAQSACRKHSQVAEPRSTRSPGWNEVEPWVRCSEKIISPERAMCYTVDLQHPFRAWEPRRNANPGFRSQARFTLGCGYCVASRLFFSAA
jgi:hypothetical protein